MTPLSKFLAEVEARCAKATEGPWAWEQYGEKENCYHVGVACDKNNKPVEGRVETERYDEDKDVFVEDVLWKHDLGELEGATVNYDDADFITHARRDLPAALALLRAFAAVVEEAREVAGCHGPWEDLRKALAAANAALAAVLGDAGD